MAIEGVPVTEEKNSLAVCLDSLFSYEGIMRNSEYLLAQGKTVQEVLEENLDGMQVLDLSAAAWKVYCIILTEKFLFWLFSETETRY